MDNGYPYYTATSTGQDLSSAQHHLRHPQSQSYPRPSDHPHPRHVYSYQHAQAPQSVPAHDERYHIYAQQPQHQHGSPYHSPTSQTMSGTLPPPTHPSPGYSRSATQGAGRYDGSPSGGFVPPLASTLHDLPFSPPRSAASAGGGARNSWGPPSRSPPMYDRRDALPLPSSSSTYPPSGNGAQHPSLSHSTSFIPTPAQTAHSYRGYSSGSSSPGGGSGSGGGSGGMPVVASIPPASGATAPQERFFCDKCDKSFGRAHDKKRHYESAHLQTHHECRFCHKCFSRNDSLKRHQDNGCEKDPSFQP
ncbi:hypothetical protein BC628DRAFT_1411685 [Trametes gibbosa]|uniref:Zinc finger protein 228 n=1 Tax=Trametes gibbosa TaxID=160864 RepID=A0A6B9KJT5_9APHY|nr:hypothetical protein BC628DRAFT_1411685 [Trametes gibbosa]QHA24601.1 zinc finger protein 228 [Trametes gibbosa]